MSSFNIQHVESIIRSAHCDDYMSAANYMYAMLTYGERCELAVEYFAVACEVYKYTSVAEYIRATEYYFKDRSAIELFDFLNVVCNAEFGTDIASYIYSSVDKRMEEYIEDNYSQEMLFYFHAMCVYYIHTHSLTE